LSHRTQSRPTVSFKRPAVSPRVGYLCTTLVDRIFSFRVTTALAGANPASPKVLTMETTMDQLWLRLSLTALLGVGTSVSAQSPTQPPPDQPTAAVAAQPNALSLTGCLRGSAAAIGTSPGQGIIYTLEVVEAAPAKPAASTPPSGAARNDAPTMTTYTLDAPDSVGLAKHVDHEVQIEGSMRPATKPATPGGAGASAAPVAGKPGGAHRTVHVSALKMLSTNCSKK
jgi:hypothetical protein